MGKKKEIATKGEALGQVVLDDQKQDTERKYGEPEQTASMGSYFVCHTQLVADMLLTCSQRLFSYVTGKDRIALALALLCSIASGVVC